jgi:putative FmdB family regulatory protein
MPLYEYECFVCHHRFERIQKATADPVQTCPDCGGAVRRLLGVPALQFKGSGWYVTDYGKGSSTAAASPKPTPAESAAAESGASSPAPSASSGKASETSKTSS